MMQHQQQQQHNVSTNSSEDEFHHLFSPLKFLTTLDAERMERDSHLVHQQQQHQNVHMQHNNSHLGHDNSFDETSLGVVPFGDTDDSSAALNAYYAQMQMDSITRSSASSPLTTSTPAASSQGQPHILRKATRKRTKGDNSGLHNDAAAEMSFDLTSPPMNAGYHNPTAQSTPVNGIRRNGNGIGVAGLSSMLTTPNNSVLSLIQEVEANSVGLGDINTPKSSISQRNSPVRNQAKLS